MEIRVERGEQAGVIRVSGDVDLYHSHRLKDAITELAGEASSGIVLDLGGATYIDSSGVGVLIYAKSLCSKKGIPLRIVNLSDPVRKVLELTKLMSYLPLSDSEAGAIRELDDQNGA